MMRSQFGVEIRRVSLEQDIVGLSQGPLGASRSPGPVTFVSQEVQASGEGPKLASHSFSLLQAFTLFVLGLGLMVVSRGVGLRRGEESD